jgi:hypothetical protein
MKMQDKILNAIEESAKNYGLDFIISYGASNTGQVYIMDEFKHVLIFTFNFQTSYCSIDFYKPGTKPGSDKDKIKPGSNGYLEYFKEAELKAVVKFADDYMMGYDMGKVRGREA